MNTTLKVFIVIVLVTAMAFAWIQMTLFATRENWKRRWATETEQQAKEIKALSSKVTTETYEKVKAQNLIIDLERKLSDLDSKVKEVEAKVTDQQAVIAQVQTERDTAKVDLAAEKERNSTLSTQLEQTRTRNNELQHIASVARGVAHQLNLKLSEVEDDLHNTANALDKARQDLTEKTKVNADNEARLALVRERHPKVWEEVVDQTGGQKFVQGIVAAVNTNPQGQQDLVMLTIGKDEGIEEGMEFILFRGNQYIVKVRAEKVLNDMVAARVIPDTWNAAGALIQVNDMAQNRL